ncbi:hypothetical protein BUC_6474 [Burkholderia pseudomallei 576]|nr:hypothetical protein BUC_6474 [Burkholderia pseudomallei 576]
MHACSPCIDQPRIQLPTLPTQFDSARTASRMPSHFNVNVRALRDPSGNPMN